VIELRDVHKSFGDLHVLKGVDLTIPKGETLVVLGRSGTGKSVTLKHIVGLIKPDSGEVFVNGINVTDADTDQLREVRRDVAYLFQTGALVNWLSVRANVALPLVEMQTLPPSAIRERVDESLQSLGMLEAAERMPAEISGGMRKRAALARVLVAEPQAILYDEPTAGLDPIMARTVGSLILDVQASGEHTALVVTHDLELAFAVATRIGLHYQGQLIELATPAAFKKSKHPIIRAFLDGEADPEPEPSL
jgi:phospholipid/cholesterol/gamma-HCH transport system ATP-binding protein